MAVRSLNVSPVRTSFESPWQNGVAERWVESCRRVLLDHLIVVNERHLKRLLSDYARCNHEDRIFWTREGNAELQNSMVPASRDLRTPQREPGPSSGSVFTLRRGRIAPAFVADEVLPKRTAYFS